MKTTLGLVTTLLLMAACSSEPASNDTNETETTSQDITEAIFTETSADCEEYINEYFSTRQMSFIQTGLNVSEKFKAPKSQQDYKAIQKSTGEAWCESYGIPTRNVSLRINKY